MKLAATSIPISAHAPALRIIGATTSRFGSSACTGPTVAASSPVPSHAFEITPVLTQRFSVTSWSLVRSKPAYSSSRKASSSVSISSRRAASARAVSPNAVTSAGSAFHETYSGGS